MASRMLRNESVVVEIQAFDYNTPDKDRGNPEVGEDATLPVER